MKPHWNAEQFADHVVAPREPSHASECPECGVEVEQFRRELGGFRQSVHASAQKPPFFWSAQQTAVSARIRKASRSQGIFWALGSTAALCALAVAMLLPGTSVPTEIARQSDPDELLMRQVQQTLTSDIASPLQPTRLIANEMNQAYVVAQQKSTSK